VTVLQSVPATPVPSAVRKPSPLLPSRLHTLATAATLWMETERTFPSPHQTALDVTVLLCAELPSWRTIGFEVTPNPAIYLPCIPISLTSDDAILVEYRSPGRVIGHRPRGNFLVFPHRIFGTEVRIPLRSDVQDLLVSSADLREALPTAPIRPGPVGVLPLCGASPSARSSAPASTAGRIKAREGAATRRVALLRGRARGEG
jgi:hypothetical protein